jgi:DNA helicase-2/ATP-dependent DNA helicase PcrA
LDFNSLILEAYRLAKNFPAIAARYRRSYPQWLVDEFQGTNRAHYKLVRTFAGQEFRNLFAVADDNQIICEWNGANFKQIQSFLADHSPRSSSCPPTTAALLRLWKPLIGLSYTTHTARPQRNP